MRQAGERFAARSASLKPTGTMTSLWMKFKKRSATPGRVAFMAVVTVISRIRFSSLVLPH